MKRLLYLFIFFISTYNLYSQTQSVTLDQIKVYETNKDKYIDKPLNCLVKDIQYPIKKIIALPTYQIDSVNTIRFFFSDTTRGSEKGFKPITLVITLYQNENFMLEEQPRRPRIKPRLWDNKYIDSVGHLKVKRIFVFEKYF